MCESPENRPSIYPTTRWTEIIDVIQKGGDDESLAALGELFEQYRPAIHAFFTRFNRDRANDLTSAFFESRVIVPWNRRHGSLSPLYAIEDIYRLDGFSESLRQRKRPLTEYLWGILSDSTRNLLGNSGLNEEQAEDLRVKLVADFNAILQGPSIYEGQRFADVELSLESRNLIQREQTGNWAVWLNRSLLADAFPGQLAKGIGFLYMVERQEQRKFRTFLAHAMWWFLKDATKTERAQNARGERRGISLEELREIGVEIPDESPEMFGRHLDEEFAERIFALAAKQFHHSAQFEAHLWEKVSQRQAAEALGLSENAFRQGYFRFRQRLGHALRKEVVKVAGPDEADIRGEMSYLMSLLAK